MREHRLPTTTTQKHVLSASGNQCAFPGCSRLIFDLTHETLIGTISHIRARRENGRRFDPNQSEEDNRSFGNLVAMCAEHSKIIDGPKWADFAVSTLSAWKREHELKIAGDSDRSWIRPPNSITRMDENGERLHFSYWVDRHGRPRALDANQLAVLNSLMALNMLLLKLGALPENLKEAKNADVATVLQQSWAEFPTEQSVVADLTKLFAMASGTTFAEFLGFMIVGNDPTSLVQEGARRLQRMSEGEMDPIVSPWFKSDILSK